MARADMTDSFDAALDANWRTRSTPRPAKPILVLTKIRSIMDAFTTESPELTLQEIQRTTGLATSTCQRLVQNLVVEGFLDRDGLRYRIGLGIVRWSAPGLIGLDLARIAHDSLRQLRDVTGETAALLLRHRGMRTVVALAETRHAVRREIAIGTTMPLHAGSAGKVFLAFDPEARSAVISQGLTRYTEHTTVSIDELDRQVLHAREAGYAITFEEHDSGAGSISAPVFGPRGQLAAAMTLAAPVERMREPRLGVLTNDVVKYAGILSSRLAGR